MWLQDEQQERILKHQSNLERLADTRFHDWYRMVYAYSDQIITDLATEWDITEDDLLLDPFVGTGTTCLAAKKLGIDSIGMDALPSSVLASRVKTNWSVDVDEFRRRANEVLQTVEPAFREISSEGNVTLRSFGDESDDKVSLEKYDLEEPDKTPKDWLSEKPRKKMLVLKHEVEQLPNDGITDLIKVAMIAIMPEDIANIGFGPEAYKVDESDDADVYTHFSNKLERMERDLRQVQKEIGETEFEPGATEIVEGDARVIGDTLRDQSALLAEHGSVDYVITSPPYPAEHDYTRNQRLELVWLDEVTDNSSLQRVKKNSIRSNTKNIYVDDDDGDQTNIRENEKIDDIVSEMEQILEEENITHGFGQYYPRVVEEYFGGMQRHFEQLHEIMSCGGLAGYVVADQASYWQVEIPTGEILGELAENRVGFEVEGIELWRNVAATTGKQEDLREEILVLRKPG